VPFSAAYKPPFIGNITKYYKASFPKEIIDMAQLGSPGVQVNVIDESFYNPATPGTIPLVVVATAQDKFNASGTGVAPGTTIENANELYLATSQKDLTDRFGVPVFQKDSSGNAIQGSELNEYGLFAAYSFLGASSSAYILRANVDLGALEGRAIAPVGRPAADTYWLDTSRTRYGVFEWNDGLQRFTNKAPLVLESDADIDGVAPRAGIGSIGDYAVVVKITSNVVWYKNRSGTWVKVGSPEWAASHPTVSFATPEEDFTINGADIVVEGENPPSLQIQMPPGLTVEVVNGTLTIYSTGVDVVVEDAGAANGTYKAPTIQFSTHTSVPFWTKVDSSPRPTGSIWIKTTEFNLGARWTVKKYNADTRIFEVKDAPVYVGGEAAIFALDQVGGGTNIPVNTIFVDANFERDGVAGFELKVRASANETVGSSNSVTFISGATASISVSEPGKAAMSAPALVELSGNIDAVLTSINNSSVGEIGLRATSTGANNITLTHPTGGEIHLIGAAWSTFFGASTTGIDAAPTGSGATFRISNWQSLTGYVAQATEPTSTPADNTLWYASYQNQVDIMIHNGSTWVGYRNVYSDTRSTGPFIQASTPTGAKANDLWIDTSDQDNYGRNIKRFIGGNWESIDVTDKTSQFGIIFADARWGTSGETSDAAGTISELLVSDYLDPDAPDPAAYPRGMLLWNTRRSGFNIKQYRRNYINTNDVNTRYDSGETGVIPTVGESMTEYKTDRWVSVSGQDLNQVAHFGRKAQRAFVVGQLKVAINTNQRILDEDNIFFNLIACPGYPELIGDMVNLNNARNGTALIVGDTPMRLESNAQSLINYGTDFANTGIDGEEGLHTNSDHLAVYYPSGLTTDLSGANVVVPPSHMMLRTIAISDQRSFQWFAPAGTRRGGITNASSVGYLRGGSFVPVSLNQGTRDQMAQIKINPITNIPGAGLVAFGQQTKTGVNSSLDRINVARLVSYLRRQLGIITKPFLFEPNDKQTRSEIKNVCESLMLDLVSLRGVYDFIVVCDETNNTPSVIASNELYVDIAVEPVKAVEFIYIPLRLKNVGDIKSRQ
jgi:hypothetical protein